MKFKNFLTEAPLSLDQALEVFGLTRKNTSDVDLLKNTYKKLSKKYHPDLPGGDITKMQYVNNAWEVLKNFIGDEKDHYGKPKKPFDWDELYARYRELAIAVNAALDKEFNPKVFTDYFSKYAKVPFSYEITNRLPRKNDKHPSYAGFEVQFFDTERTHIFQLEVTTQLNGVYRDNNTLATGDISFNVYTTTHVITGAKKVKMSKRDWVTTNDHVFFKDPSKVFPTNKIKPMFENPDAIKAKGQFKKADMFSFLDLKLKATIKYPDFSWVPIGAPELNLSLGIYRSTMMGQASWGVNGFYIKRMSRVNKGRYVSFPESAEFAGWLLKMQNDTKTMNNQEEVVNYIANDAEKMYDKMAGL